MTFDFILNPYEASNKRVSITICYMSRHSPHGDRMYFCVFWNRYSAAHIYLQLENTSIKDSTSCVIVLFLKFWGKAISVTSGPKKISRIFLFVRIFLKDLIMTGTRISQSLRQHIFSWIMLIDVVLTFRTAAHRTVILQECLLRQKVLSLCKCYINCQEILDIYFN